MGYVYELGVTAMGYTSSSVSSTFANAWPVTGGNARCRAYSLRLF